MKAISTKEWAGFLKARREYPSQNDGYNRKVFGITLARYWEIHQATLNARGMDCWNATREEANKALTA